MNGEDPLYTGEWTVGSLLEDRATRLRDRMFVTTPAEDLTYGELGDRVRRAAGGLVTAGVQPGDRVATMLPPSLEYLVTWFAVAWAGAVDVPVNTELKGDFLRHVLTESEPTALVIDARWIDRLADLGLPVDLTIVVVGDDGAGRVPFEQVTSGPDIERTERAESDLVYIMYTSGTTGPAKGAMLTNRAALWNAYSWIDILELGSEDVAYSMFPMFHVTARSAVITSSMWAGASVALRDGFSVGGFWDDVRASGATFFAYMGAVIHLLHAQPPDDRDLDNRVSRAFGAAAPPGVAEAFEARFGLELLEVYGSTELGPATAPRPGRVKRGTMGRVCQHVELQIQDELGQEVAPGDNGEICARPAEPWSLFSGYWRRPEATVEAFRDLWFHTGDRGRFDDEGYLTFVDRMKDCIRRRGENISSFEVERAVEKHPDVHEAAAFGVPSELTEEEVMVAVVPTEPDTFDGVEVLTWCSTQMPRFTVPTFLRVVAELPKTPSQRIQKFRLRETGVTEDTLDRRALGIEIPRS